MRQLPIFVYGTLKPGFAAHARWLRGRTDQELPAHIEDAALYSDGRYPYLVVEPALISAGERAYGFVVNVLPALYAATLTLLDRYEDYRPLSALRMYDRVVLTAQTELGSQAVWAYTAGPRVLSAARLGHISKVPGGAWAG